MKGFADLHNRQFAYLGFGGMAFHGRAFGDPRQALPWYNFGPGTIGPRTPIHGAGGMGDIFGNFVKGTHGSSLVGHKVGEYPQFDGWPR